MYCSSSLLEFSTVLDMLKILIVTACRESGVMLHTFLTLAVGGDGCHSTFQKIPAISVRTHSSHRVKYRIDPRLPDWVEKNPPSPVTVDVF